jgi:hypothetical protein
MKRRTVEETTKQWMVYLNDLKYHMDNFNIEYLTEFSKKHQIDSKLGHFLKKSKVISKNNFGYYKWNEKIPVSIKLINAYRKEQFKRNASKYRIKKHLNTNKPIQQELNLLVEPEKQKKKLVTKVNPKKVIKVAPKLIREDFKNTDKQELGLIRKFLKWIY